MWFKRNNEHKTVVVDEPVDEPETVKQIPPVASLPEANGTTDDETVEWLSLCKELNIVHGQPNDVELLAFLRTENIQVFRTQRVFNYLTSEATRLNTTWNLYPLRDEDAAYCKETSLWAEVLAWPKANTVARDRCYRDRVPIPALLTIKRIVARFGEDVHFYVASFPGDPFLGVCYRDSHLVFIERWDEPGFRS